MRFDWPEVAVLIPAHNEGMVIRSTLEAMLAFDYPTDRYEVLVINDGSSDDTGAIVQEFADRDRRIRLINVKPGEGGKGKSRALNIGLAQTDAGLIAVYDADNTPEPAALRYLVAQLLLHPELGACIGKFRTVNKNRNLLTRFINVETLSFQSIVQAGRWKLFRVSTLPGTNFVIRRPLLDHLGGWDESAITEDSEMSIRIYMEGFRIKVIPYAVTHEQEPETWSVWFKQRIALGAGQQLRRDQVREADPEVQGQGPRHRGAVPAVALLRLLRGDRRLRPPLPRQPGRAGGHPAAGTVHRRVGSSRSCSSSWRSCSPSRTTARTPSARSGSSCWPTSPTASCGSSSWRRRSGSISSSGRSRPG